MSIDNLIHLSAFNRELLFERERLRREIALDPSKYQRWRPCTVRVLVLVDGLDYSPTGDFSLSVFVSSLLASPWYVRFAITLAHIDDLNVSDLEMMPGESRIARRIVNFKFDDAGHFPPNGDPNEYDVVFLFGIATMYFRGPGYPSDSLSDSELQALALFQNGGGGLFATGDHAALGRAMCHKVARARDMRLWQSTPNRLGEDMVSMAQRYRNDTNRPGRNANGDPGGSDFNDESDDIPQTISPVLYNRISGLFRYNYPHPLLCGPKGVIRVMPDHPHEGECKRPSDLGLTLNYTGPAGPEYPLANDGSRPEPEIISYNTVLADTTSGGKDPTVAQSFPGICAYDGHRAGIGRVVTDATWHHFVNVNLIGRNGIPDEDPSGWGVGFLRSAAGAAALENVKAYYRNLAVWLARPQRIKCMNSRLLWHAVFDGRVLEAVLTAREVGIDKMNVRTLSLIGAHARDVLGNFVSRCRTLDIIFDLIAERPRLIPEIDPWDPLTRVRKDFEDADLPVFDVTPMLDAALGGGLAMLNDRFPRMNAADFEKLETDEVLDVARKGAAIALDRAQESLQRTIRAASSRFLDSRTDSETS